MLPHTMTATRVQAPIQHWYRDPISCLHATLASLLIAAGEEPLDALGLGWEFRYLPGDTRPEEFYWPCRFPGDLARSVLPHHDVTSEWRAADDPLADWAGALADGRLPIVAVDNYHLPFRPAYRDVHAAHLIVLYDLDPAAGTAGVSDAMPPAYQGPLAIEDLLAAGRSANPRGGQDAFFSGARIGRRWLDVRLGGPFPPLTRARLRQALAANLSAYTSHSDGPGWTGHTGLTRFCTELDVAEAYAFGWSAQAQAALHGELLRRYGWRWELPELAEAGRRVEKVGHRWASLRVAAAHTQTGGQQQNKRHADGLRRAYDEALASLELAIDALRTGSASDD